MPLKSAQDKIQHVNEAVGISAMSAPETKQVLRRSPSKAHTASPGYTSYQCGSAAKLQSDAERICVVQSTVAVITCSNRVCIQFDHVW